MGCRHVFRVSSTPCLAQGELILVRRHCNGVVSSPHEGVLPVVQVFMWWYLGLLACAQLPARIHEMRICISFELQLSPSVQGARRSMRVHRCIDALIAMGVLVEGGDRVSIRRTALFFLNSFDVGHPSLICPMLTCFSL